MDLEFAPRPLLIVTPARNEALNIPILAASLKAQEFLPEITWVIVDDGSTDETALVATKLDVSFTVKVLRREKEGLLITGAAYAAWWQGVNHGLLENPSTGFVMKLDADVKLDEKYFLEIFSVIENGSEGIFGGVISGLHREQKAYVPGPVKMYSRKALEALRDLPIATGFDVMDEIFCRDKGFSISVVNGARFTMIRQIGHSQGLLHGRFRNGLVCKWVGYDHTYFFLHMMRYALRKPFILGSVWMFWGYVTSENGPYPEDLRMLHRSIQRKRLVSIIQNPYRTLKELYA